MVKSFKAGIIFFATWAFLSAAVAAEVVDRIVAVVNNDIVTLSELNNAFETYQKRIEASYKGQDLVKVVAEARLAMLNKMIDQSLIDQEAKKSGIVIKDDEVTDTIKDFLDRRKMKMEDLLKSLANDRSSFEEYKKEVKDQLLRMRLVRREIKSKVAVSDEEIGSYYLKHREEYEGKEAVRIKQILVPFPKNVDEATKVKLRGDMAAIHKRLKDGEPFDMLAARYSQEAAAAAGGDIGFIERGMILPAVEDVAFSLQRNETSGIIESPIGLHIIMAVDRRGEGIKPIESVRTEIRDKLEEEQMEKKYTEWIKELRNKSHIEIKL